MRKEHAMAIFVGVIMVSSVAGFAITGLDFENQNSGTQNVPNVVDRALTREEFRSVLLSGKTIIQDHYDLSCASCATTSQIISAFTQGMDGFVVLEQFGVQFQNETKLQIVSSDGRITELNPAGLTEDSLLGAVCSASYVQPKKCLLRDIG
jgi:hypothetical protein